MKTLVMEVLVVQANHILNYNTSSIREKMLIITNDFLL